MVDDRCLDGLRALVVEDDYFIADDLKQILKRRGASTVSLSGTVRDALRRLRAGGFDVVLLDLNVHGDMAFGVADELLRENRPFGFVSGYARSAIPPRFAEVPNWGKPYEEREIVAGIRRLWGRPPSP